MYDVSPRDGRFLMLKEPSSGASPINVVVNWFDELTAPDPDSLGRNRACRGSRRPYGDDRIIAADDIQTALEHHGGRPGIRHVCRAFRTERPERDPRPRHLQRARRDQHDEFIGRLHGPPKPWRNALTAAGIPEKDIQMCSARRPTKGNLVARYRGTGARRRCCCLRTSTSSRPSAKTGSATRLPWSKRTATSLRAARRRQGDGSHFRGQFPSLVRRLQPSRFDSCADLRRGARPRQRGRWLT